MFSLSLYKGMEGWSAVLLLILIFLSLIAVLLESFQKAESVIGL